MLFNPFANTLETSTALQPLKSLCSNELILAAVFFAVGINGLFAVATNDTKRRRRAALILCIFWSFLAISFAVGDIAAPGFLIYGCTAFACGEVVARLNVKLKQK